MCRPCVLHQRLNNVTLPYRAPVVGDFTATAQCVKVDVTSLYQFDVDRCLSVRLSVCYVPVLCRTLLTPTVAIWVQL